MPRPAPLAASIADCPRVSVVIPTWNDARNLPHVFRDMPPDVHEVILVDGHSTDETIATARRLWPSVVVIEQEGRGKGNALALGFAAVTGDIVGMLDADGSADPAEIPRFVAALVAGADVAKGTRFLPGGGSTDITADVRIGASHRNRTSVLRSFGQHRRIFLTLGIGVMLLSAARNARIAIVPLWAASLGLNAAHASLIVGIAGAVDMLLFYPGGAMMDRRGRVAVAIPSMLLLGTGMIAIVFTNDFWSLVGVGVLLGIGNGIGSGLIMTLSADAAPAIGRAQFLACWRLMSDSGSALGPLLMSAITIAFPLAAASVAMGLVSYVGAGWLRVYVPRYDPILPAGSPDLET